MKRRDPLAEREAKDTVAAEEAAAGRTGGGTERAIVYNDDALDKLLDRSDLEKGLQQGERRSCGCSVCFMDALAGSKQEQHCRAWRQAGARLCPGTTAWLQCIKALTQAMKTRSLSLTS